MKNKVIFITGASAGIGEELVRTFSKDGAKVILASRNIQKLQSIADTLQSENLVLQTDIKDEKSIKYSFAKTIEKYGKIDVLINNAGTVEPLGLLDMSLEQWNDMIQTNLTGTFLCTKECVKYMKKTGGKIVNIASTAGIGARAGWSGYAASKAGVISFSETMAEELRSYGIKVYCICPGRTATDLRKKLAPLEDPTSIMQPKSVVETIKYCIESKSDVLEGQPLLVRERG